jgi:hypothetical protein
MHTWIKMQENGIAVVCEEHEAQGITLNGVNYWGEEAIQNFHRNNEREDAIIELATSIAESYSLQVYSSHGIRPIALTESADAKSMIESTTESVRNSGIAKLFARRIAEGRIAKEDVPSRWLINS